MVLGVSNPQNLNRYSYVRNNPLRYTDPSGHTVACNPYEDDCHSGTTPALLPPPSPCYTCDGGPNDDVPDPNPNSITPPTSPPPSNLIDKFLGYQYTPLMMGAIQVLSATAYNNVNILILFEALIFPEALLLEAGEYGALRGALLLVNRGAALAGAASTYYQYSHGLYGASKLDVEVSVASFFVGAAGGMFNNDLLVAAASDGSFAYTVSRTDLRPLFNP